MEFYTSAGKMALGSRLRRLSDILASDAEKLYQYYGVDIEPRWFPVFYMLTSKGSLGITELASAIGQTHPAVSQIVSSMMKKGIVTTNKSPDDARVNKVSLTDKGVAIATKLEPQCIDVDAAIAEVFRSVGSQLWSDLDAIEHALKETCLYTRVLDEKKSRESQHVTLVPFEKNINTYLKHSIRIG